jgi:hypothetical protein
MGLKQSLQLYSRGVYCAARYDASRGVDTLFRNTETLTYDNKVIFSAAGEDVLYDELHNAGKALLMALRR